MTGATNKSYFHGSAAYPNGSFCCPVTAIAAGNSIFNHNYGSDCTSPPDIGENLECTLDSWLNYGDYKGSNRNTVADASGNPFSMTYDQMTELTGAVGSNVQPLVVDLDNDGYNEIILVNSTKIYAYNLFNSSLTAVGSVSVGGNIVGTPAIEARKITSAMSASMRGFMGRLPSV